jgi:hypothetical protein
MILTYAVGNATIKYHEGFIAHPTLGSERPDILAVFRVFIMTL